MNSKSKIKLKVINSEKFASVNEIELNDGLRVDDIKYSIGGGNIDEILSLDLMYQNCVLDETQAISFYEIKSNDEIWMDRIEDYLTRDDIIVDVFVVGVESELHHLIVKCQSTVSDVITKMQHIFPGLTYFHLWQTDGEVLGLDKRVTDITSEKGGHKIILQCTNEETDQKSFDECCKIHDRYLIERYLSNFDSNSLENMEIYYFLNALGNEIKGFLYLIDQERRFDVKLSSLPASFHNSKFLFCRRLANRIFNIFRDILNTVINDLNKRFFDGMVDYFRVTLRVIVLDYLIFRDQSKTMGDIANHATQCLLNCDYNWRNWIKPFVNCFFLRPLDDVDRDEIIHHIDQQYFEINIRRHYFFLKLRIPKKLTTIRQIKKEIFLKLGEPLENLYFIDYTSDHKYGEDDDLDKDCYDNYVFELIMDIDNIEILSENFDSSNSAELVFCKNNVTNTKFLLKTIKSSDDDLYRDISMQYPIDLHVDATKSMGLFHYNGSVCMGLEYMSGGSLRSYLQDKKEQKLSEEEAAKISHQLLTQLMEIHKLGIIHRDIKPENIVFDENLNAKLIDYGMSKRINGLSEEELIKELTRSSPGTINYLAPEVFETDSCYNQKADIWSFGVVVTEMVTGQKPYCKLPDVKVGLRIKERKKINVNLDSSHSGEIKHFVGLCLKPNPEDRPPASELIQSEFIKTYLEKNNKNDNANDTTSQINK